MKSYMIDLLEKKAFNYCVVSVKQYHKYGYYLLEVSTKPISKGIKKI
jgi:hypothetical protein